MIFDKTINGFRIAFLGNQLAWGGGAKSLLLMIKSLKDENFKMYVFLTNISSITMKNELEKYVQFVKLIHLPELTGAQTETLSENKKPVYVHKFDLIAVETFAQELNDLNIDILHINNSVFSPIYEILKKKSKVKIITHVREWIAWNGIGLKQKFIIETIKRYSDSIVCISDTEAEPFLGHSDLHIVPNPFDFNEIKDIKDIREVFIKQYGLRADVFLVGMMSSFQESKGVLDFLTAALFLKKMYKGSKQIKFIFLGQKRLNIISYLKFNVRSLIKKKRSFLLTAFKFVKDNELKNDIIFLSKRKNVLEIVKLFDLAVRPSLSGDPWGRDIIEYMAMSKPIIATGTSGFFIKNTVNGFLIPTHNPQMIAEKIKELSQDIDKLKEMGESAYKEVFSKTNFSTFSRKISEIYLNQLN